MRYRGLIVIALLAGCWSAGAQVLDRVVAVVDSGVILQSELNSQIQFFALNNKVDASSPGVKDQVLQSMVNERLIVAKAIEDSVSVTDEEVQRQMDALIQQRIQQVGSEGRLEEMYGMPLSRIRWEFRDEMRNNLLAQRVQDQKFGGEAVGGYEVAEFFKAYKDSLPRVPEEMEIAHILIKPKPGEKAREAARAEAQIILDSVKAGADFADLARRHSQDPGTAAQGGDLGLVRRGQFVKEFETAVFALEDGQVSGLVETEFGFHIIQLLERRGDAVHPRHILIRIERTKESDSTATALLDSLRVRELAGENFAELAKKYSEDKETNLLGGNLGTVQLEQLDKAWYAAVVNLKPGEISAPTPIPLGSTTAYHIVLVKSRTPAHEMTLDQDYRKLEAMALNMKRMKDYQAWIDELKSKIYWQIRP